jgi:CDP-glucose 4,6-dehydratase
MDPGSWRGRRVLITGHTGFKGAWLALWLHELGAEVTGFAGPPPTTPSLFELARVTELLDDRRGDVCDRAEVLSVAAAARPDVVFHLAAQALVREGLAFPERTWEVNVLGTVHVLEATRAVAPDAATVVVTSDKCYATPRGDRRLREDDPLGGSDPYSASKAAQELVVASHRACFGLRAATARAGNVIGGGDWGRDRLVPDFVRAATTGTALEIRSPEAVRPWQHVLNPLSGYLTLAERLTRSPVCARAWNFGPQAVDERPVRWVVERLCERWVGAPEVRHDSGHDPRETATLRLDSTLARERLGWAPPWTLEQGLEATVAWHRASEEPDAARNASLEQIGAFARASAIVAT